MSARDRKRTPWISVGSLIFVLSITRIHAIRDASDKAMRESPMLVHPASAPTEQPPRKLSGTRTAWLDDLERDAFCVHRRGHPRRKAWVNLSGTATDGGQLVGFGRSGPCLIAEVLRGTHCSYWRRHNRHHNYLCSHRSRPCRYGIRPPALRSNGDVFCEWWAAFSQQRRGLESAIYVTESCQMALEERRTTVVESHTLLAQIQLARRV